jgi:hypothetical protein
MIISRQDILEVRKMSDCALVVREEFWDQQLKIYAQLRGIKLDKQQIDRVIVIIVDFGKKVGEAIIRLSEILYESFEKAWLSVKDTIEALKKFVDECEITFDDDFDTICDKLENRMLYLNRQEYIRSEQYYKSQFRLTKMNYNILHHDRRC